jgi:thioesterase domain-containing protein
MPVLTIFYIGTNHERDETSNILVVLHKSVDAGALAAGEVPTTGAGHFKMIFDGAPNLADLDDMISKFRTPSVQMILRLQALKPHTANDPWQIHLVGHSRGAVAAIALAAELNERDNPAIVRMFLIDPVRRTAFADTPEQGFGITVHNNTHEFFEFYMEDDISPKLERHAADGP